MACPHRAPLFAVRPLEGGIHPRTADHHAEHASKLFQQALEMNDIDSSQIARIAFSQGPGLGPCLRVGASIARGLAHRLNVPLIGVNHCVAHIEVGRTVCEVDDPVLLYVSGGNTQVIARRSGRYRVLGETLDIGIGNMLDKFGRGFGIAFPAGPAIEQHARAWVEDHPDDDMEGVRLPYAVRGMDLAFSGYAHGRFCGRRARPTLRSRLLVLAGTCLRRMHRSRRTSFGTHGVDGSPPWWWRGLQPAIAPDG